MTENTFKINLLSQRSSIFYILAVFLMVATCFLHFWKLEEVPQGLFIDEASVAYNAFCLGETGADEYNNKYPVLFRCFDNYHDTVMVYSLVPFFKIFGLQKWVSRSLSGIYLILASLAFYYLSFSYTRNKWFSLMGAFVFSILPWLFPLSRTGIGGYTPMLLGINLGWLFIFKAFGRRSYWAAFLAAFFWAFTMYSHNCGRPMTAVFLIVFGLSLNWILLKRIKIFACFTVLYLSFMLPMIWYVIKVPGSMSSRFSEISVWGDNPSMGILLSRIIVRYLDYFNPVFLFFSGDSNLRHNAGGGELFLFMAPLILLGLYICIKKFNKNPYYRFLLISLLCYPAAAVLTEGRMHSTRTMNGAPFWCILAVVGAVFLWRLREKYRIIPLAMIFLMMAICIETTKYMKDYFGDYQERSKFYFDGQYVAALEYACNELKPGQKLYISGYFFPHQVNTDFKPYWYAILLFARKIPPKVYQNQGIPADMISHYFGQELKEEGILLISNCQPRGITRKGQLVIQKNTEKVPANASLLKKIYVNEWRYIEIFKINKLNL